jgi:hypothetical protein
MFGQSQEQKQNNRLSSRGVACGSSKPETSPVKVTIVAGKNEITPIVLK